MCGRYFIEGNAYENPQLLRDLDTRRYENVKTGEISPTDTAPIMRRDGASATHWLESDTFARFILRRPGPELRLRLAAP